MANASGNNEIKGVTLVIVALLCAGSFLLAMRLNEQLKTARAQVAALEKRPTDEERIARMRTERAEALKAHDEVAAELATSQKRAEAVEKRLAILEAAAKPQRKLIDDLKAQLIQKDTEREKIVAQRDELKQKTIPALETKVVTLEAENARAKVEAKAAADKLAESAKMKESLDKQLAASAERVAQMKKSAEAAQQAAEELKKQTTALTEKLKAAEAENKKLQEQVQALQAAIKKAEAERDAAKAEAEKARNTPKAPTNDAVAK